ncbi:alpha/beta hydrolase [Algoriphagus sp.]|uniref:alpha/beta fold hydrolase n=1 Tax=Algoriphagus sp. TaxID=1872435 RepID=UPI0025DBB012|nr:alpha/beta hydrolase [Algoriphagus sp.]
MKWLLYVLSSILVLILVLLLVIRINSSGIEEPFLDNDGNVLPNSIAYHEDMVINGAPQRVTIRGKDINNPVLLRVIGGPGAFHTPAANKVLGVDLEDLFTVCYWDQRGAGPAYDNSIPDSTITLEQIVEDGLDVTKFLIQKFNKDKIYIEGMSWGTTVSAYMVQKKPELFKAYIGIGQMANQPLSEQMSFDFAMGEAQKHNDQESIEALNKIGRPPYPHMTNVEMAEACDVEREVVYKYAISSFSPSFKELSGVLLDNGAAFKEKYAFFQYYGTVYPAYNILWPTCFNINLIRDVPEWKIPVYIMQGDNDHSTETSLAKAYFDTLKAPLKKWFLFENATHEVLLEYPEKYRSIYIAEVLRN